MLFVLIALTMPPLMFMATPDDIAYLWLAGDHYKWRGMRSCGISEEYITGDKTPYEKFKAWASAMPNLIGNPLYYWTHLELKNYFGIDDVLCEETCEEIWNKCNECLEKDEFSAKNLILKSGVEIMQMLHDLHKEGNTIIIITHDLNIAKQAERIAEKQRVHTDILTNANRNRTSLAFKI